MGNVTQQNHRLSPQLREKELIQRRGAGELDEGWSEETITAPILMYLVSTTWWLQVTLLDGRFQRDVTRDFKSRRHKEKNSLNLYEIMDANLSQ